MNDNELYARNARLAEAMGWQPIPVELPDITMPITLWCHPDQPAQVANAQPLPEFHASQDAKAGLLAWLAEDADRWQHFLAALMRLLGLRGVYALPEAGKMMLATPAQVAEAAETALQEIKTPVNALSPPT